jgi:hypothetical protein
MEDAFKERLKRVGSALAALAIAVTISGFSVLGTASVAGAEPAVPADEVGVLSTACYTGTGWGYPGGNPAAGERNYAWARCTYTGTGVIHWYEFRVEWSCTGEGYMRRGPWHASDGSTLRGWCGPGKTVDVYRHGSRYIGP